VGIRSKLFLVFFALGIVPVLLLSTINYWYGVRAVGTLLRNDVERDAVAVARGVETRERECEAGLIALARARAVRDYVRAGAREELPPPAKANGRKQPGQSTGPLPSSAGGTVPEDVRAATVAFLLGNQRYFASITCLDTSGRPLFRVEQDSRDAGETRFDADALRFQTRDFLPDDILADERVWTTTEQTPLRSHVARESSGLMVRHTAPVFTAGEEGGGAARGALIAELRLDALLKDAASSFTARPPSSPAREGEPAAAAASRLVVVLDHTGRILYHTNDALLYQSVISSVPSFKQVAEAMMAGESGSKFYDSADGHRWLATYRPVAPLDLSVAAAGDYTAAARSLHLAGWVSLVLSALAGLASALLLSRGVRRTARGIERVTEGAVAIAGGNLNERIEVRSSDEVRLLADSFNRMTDRLREQIAREAEARQFHSFMRLSAMLTHDLKNAISSLSLLVRNMERQFDNEEFRADAMRSLKDATDKLRALVARLSEPVRSLSGEFERPRPTDLALVIKRVLATTVDPARSLHEVETRLPPRLVATVDATRIEKVIENLVLNALEAMGTRKGKLTVEAGTERDDQVFVSITDTGSGMSDEFQRTKLFHAFATTKSKGIGLGLYTCREVIRAHGGRIDVKSQKDVGTTFRIVLPSSQITELVTSSRPKGDEDRLYGA
jgi:signal transduction histidine kinase